MDVGVQVDVGAQVGVGVQVDVGTQVCSGGPRGLSRGLGISEVDGEVPGILRHSGDLLYDR